MILTVAPDIALKRKYIANEDTSRTASSIRESSLTAMGKGINVSKNLSIYRKKTKVCGWIDEEHAVNIEKQISSYGIEPALVRIKSHIRAKICIYDIYGKLQSELSEPGEPVLKSDMERYYSFVRRQIERSNVVVIAGAPPKEMYDDFYPTVISMAKEKKLPVLLDMDGKNLFSGVMKPPTFLKLSHAEISELMSEREPKLDRVIRFGIQIHEAGIRYLLITLGEYGSVLICDEGILRARVPSVQKRSAISSGDALMAGMAISFEDRMRPADGLRLATAMSVANVVQKETAFFTLSDLKKYKERVSITKL